MKLASAFFSKLRWLFHNPVFQKTPLLVAWRALIWEGAKFFKWEIPFVFDSTFAVRLQPGEGVSRLTFYFGNSEPDLFAFYDSFLQKGMVAVDVGANIGLHTLFMAKRVAPGGRVLAFEPSPKNFSRLKEHVEKNCADNVHIFPLAVGDCAGTGFFYENANDSSRSHFSNKGSGLVVEIIRLDDICRSEGVQRIDFLKLDVEGFEMRALEGAEPLFFAGSCAVLQIELDPNNLARQGSQENKVASWLIDRGYRFVVWDSSAQKFKPARVDNGCSYNSFFVSPSFRI
ncbi:FkbM family methyltransferase [bacterium]|nr:FkbM family methyltransferase [bacterium]